MPGFNRVQQRQRIPVVMAPTEVSAVFKQMSGSTALMVRLMFGYGLRVEECCTLRIKDIDFASAIVSVRDGILLRNRLQHRWITHARLVKPICFTQFC